MISDIMAGLTGFFSLVHSLVALRESLDFIKNDGVMQINITKIFPNKIILII